MRLERISVPMLHRAIDLFIEISYRGAGPPKPVTMPAGDSAEEALSDFKDSIEADRTTCSRYVIRLGSTEYPFMKLAVEEYLLEDQYFFIVDTHDQMELKPGMPDYDSWNDLKRRNREIKLEIERRWADEGLPTLADLKKVTAEVPVGDRVSEPRDILIVDDEVPLAESLGALLERKGYRVTTRFDGHAALELLAHEKPDLIVMDYEMPRLDGIELCIKLRDSQDTVDIPVLLATTCSTVDLQAVMKLANGFLVKPYQKEILFDCISHLIR